MGAEVLAVVAAFLFTAGLAMQQRANLDAMRSAPGSGSGAGAGAVDVVRRPMWLLGGAVGLVGFVIEGVALRLGAFLLVVPVLATQLVFMVPCGAWVVRGRVQRREWIPAILVLVGIVVFEVAFRPEAGRATGTPLAWVLTFAVSAVAIAALFAAGRLFGSYRAALYGCGAGTWAALVGALLKEATGASLWAFAAIVVAGPLNVVLLNLAVRAGRLSSAQTTVVAIGTVVSLVVGVVVFAETVSLDAWRIAAGVAAVVAAGWGIAGLARSPSLLVLDEITHPEAGL